MNQKSSYQAPVLHPIKMEGEGVIAASTQDFGAGKRYDLGQPTAQSLTRGLFRWTKNLLPLMAAAVALLLPACSSEGDPVTQEAHPGKSRIILTAGIDEVATRTTYTPGTNTEGTADLMHVVWTSGATESLRVVSYNEDTPNVSGAAIITGTGTGTKSMTFDGGDLVPDNVGGTLGAKAHNYIYDPEGIGSYGTTSVSFDFKNQSCPAILNDNGAVRTNAPVELKRYDIMYTSKVTDQSNITLKHVCALIRFDLPLDTEKTITKITMSVAYMANNSAQFPTKIGYTYHTNGNATSTQQNFANSISLAITGDDATTPRRVLTAYLMLPLGNGTVYLNNRLVKVSAIAGNGTATTDDDTVFSRTLYPSASGNTLQAGNCYTFFGVDTTTPLAEDRWAGSNIYANSSGTLTFVKEPYDMSKVNYQGLYFKWGSTVGIAPNSPLGSWYTYPQIGESNPQTVWSNIPYDTSTSTPDIDICTTLNSNYRMPTREEIADIAGSSRTKIGNWDPITPTTTNQQGTTTIPGGTLVGNVFFPASGEMRETTLVNAGNTIYYWSNEAYSGTLAYAMLGYSSGTISNPSTMDKASNAYSIRCIKK
jgi:hypothetical protein